MIIGNLIDDFGQRKTNNDCEYLMRWRREGGKWRPLQDSNQGFFKYLMVKYIFINQLIINFTVRESVVAFLEICYSSMGSVMGRFWGA